MATSGPGHPDLSLSARVKKLQDDTRVNYQCRIEVNQDFRTPAQAQEFHVCHMFLKNYFAEKGILPRYVSKLDGRTIDWEHLKDPSVEWKLIRAEDFLKTAAGLRVKRNPKGTAWFLGYEPDRSATARYMTKFLESHHVAKQAAPGVTGCGEPCCCGGRASRHISGEAFDLQGLDKLEKILVAAAPGGMSSSPLDQYLLTFGLWRPMAHKPEKSREPWHVESLPTKHKHRLERIGSNPKLKIDYKHIVLRRHLEPLVANFPAHN